MPRFVCLVADGLGVGEAPDAAEYGDVGANTLQHTAEAVGKIQLPTLQKLGLGLLGNIPGVAHTKTPQAVIGRLKEQSSGKDTTTGHWEIAGLITRKPFTLFPQGFPPALVDSFVKEAGLSGVLGNRAASGTVIIDELGDESLSTGRPILYTSGDSVFQIAAHETKFGLERLYKICDIARRLTLPHQIGRVIARPFLGDRKGEFRRTEHRRDYALSPGRNSLDLVFESGIPVYSVGKIEDIFDHRSITSGRHTGNNADSYKATLDYLRESRGRDAFVFVNLVDFDMLYGHRRDAKGFARSLEELDVFMTRLCGELKGEDCAILTADHGCDPTFRGTDHTREYVPLVAYQPEGKGKFLGDRNSFADISATILEGLGVESSELPDVGSSFLMRVHEIICRKRDGFANSPEELDFLLSGFLRGEVPDYQMSAWLMAVVLRGMEEKEVLHWTELMLSSGNRVPRSPDQRQSEFWVDKHSTGGVGDKTSLILVPWVICAFEQLNVSKRKLRIPMISGRGLGHTGGTLDKMESVPGFKTKLELEEAMPLLEKNGFFMIGQSEGFVPADRLIYALRDVTGTVESKPLIVSSILSKKFAENLDAIVFDVKQGPGAFMKTEKDSQELAQMLLDVSGDHGLSAAVVRSSMVEPLGKAVGNLVEVMECADFLEGKAPDPGLYELSLELAAWMLHLATEKKSDLEACRDACEIELETSRPREVFEKMFTDQGGSFKAYEAASRALSTEMLRWDVVADSSGWITEVDPIQTAQVVNHLGGGRARKEDAIDPQVGMEFVKKVGDDVREGEKLARIYYRNASQKNWVAEEATKVFKIGKEKKVRTQWVLETIHR